MKELELEAEKIYPIIPNGHPTVNWDRANKQEGFITGATSNAAKEYWYKEFEKEKLEFAIEQLKYVNKQVYNIRQFKADLLLDAKIRGLEQKLKEL